MSKKTWDTAIAAYEQALKVKRWEDLMSYMDINYMLLGLCMYFNGSDWHRKIITQNIADTYLCIPFYECYNRKQAREGIRTRIEFLKQLKAKYNEPE